MIISQDSSHHISATDADAEVFAYESTGRHIGPAAARTVAAYFATASTPALAGFANGNDFDPAEVRKEVQREADKQTRDPFDMSDPEVADAFAIDALYAYLDLDPDFL